MSTTWRALPSSDTAIRPRYGLPATAIGAAALSVIGSVTGFPATLAARVKTSGPGPSRKTLPAASTARQATADSSVTRLALVRRTRTACAGAGPSVVPG